MDDSALFPSCVREGGQGVLVLVASSLSRMGGRVGEDKARSKARSFGQGEASEREGHQDEDEDERESDSGPGRGQSRGKGASGRQFQ